MTSSDSSTSICAFEAMLGALPDPAMLIALPSGLIVTANELAATLLDSSVEKLKAGAAVNLRDDNDRVAFAQALDQLNRTPPPRLTFEECLRVGTTTTPLQTSHLRALSIGGQRFALHVIRSSEPSTITSEALRKTVVEIPLPMMISESDRPTTPYLNVACAQLCGLTTAGPHAVDADRRLWRLCHTDGTELADSELPWSRVLARGETFGPKELLVIPRGPATARVASVMSLPVSRDQDRRAAITTLVDMGDVRRLEHELRTEREAAESDSRRKGAFYASLSRELRNPLTTILGYLDLIADPDSRDRERDASHAQIRKSGETLMALVQDLVDLGQMEAGTFVLEKTGFSTSLALAQVLSQARARARHRERDLVARYTTPVPSKLTWDAARFRQCLSTIIHFAIENASRGDVTLQAAVIGVNKSRSLAFDVSAHCRELTQEDLDTLFDPFRPSTPRARPWSLAFPVAQRLAQAMGGTIDCSLEGDNLWFRLTVAPTEADLMNMAHLTLADDNEAPASINPPVHLHGQVLLVEDNEADRLLVSKMLERSGLSVDHVPRGADALERVTHRYDVILMDVELPGLDGLETTRRLRASGVTVPIVALTASVLTGDRQRCLNAGCTAYVPKPIDRPMLLRTLDGLISSTENRRVMSLLPGELADVEPMSSTHEDDPSLKAILPQFVIRMSRFVDHISRAIPDRQLPEAAKVARSLGATADNCGFPALGDSAAALADACLREDVSPDEIRRRLERVREVAKRIRAAYPDAIRFH